MQGCSVLPQMDAVADAAGFRERTLATFAPAACVSALRRDVEELTALLAAHAGGAAS